MGNTKTISFEGHISVTSPLDNVWLEDISHCSYCCVKIDEKGYLGLREDEKFVIGILHSYSMRGAEVVEALVSQIEYGHITYYDHDYPEYRLYIIEDNKIVENKELKMD